jgi:hypothetical protein
MIGRIRRVVAKTIGGSQHWDADWELRPESGEEPEPTEEDEEIPDTETPDVEPEGYSSQSISDRGYYEGLVSASISDGGKHGAYRISVWWLRVTKSRLHGSDEAMNSILEGTCEPGADSNPQVEGVQYQAYLGA